MKRLLGCDETSKSEWANSQEPRTALPYLQLETGNLKLNTVPSAYLSIGSNIEDRAAHLRSATAELRKLGPVTVSSFYETEPVEFTQQPWFLNCAVGLKTELTPQDLLQQILRIERELGRDRASAPPKRDRASTPPKGPRTVDIDIILYDDVVVNGPALTIPHPAMHRRRFVLEPLAEIAPDAIHPVFMRSAAALLQALPPGDGVVWRIARTPDSA